MKVVYIILGMILGAWLWGIDKPMFMVGGLLGWIVARFFEQETRLNHLEQRLADQLSRSASVVPEEEAGPEPEPVPEVELGSAAESLLEEGMEPESAQAAALEPVTEPIWEVEPGEEVMPDSATVAFQDAAEKSTTAALSIYTEAVAGMQLPAEQDTSTAKRRENHPGNDDSPSWLMEWFTGGNFLVRGGSILLFFGVAFLFKYAAEHAYLPIWARMTGVAIGGITMIVVGHYLREKRNAYALALQGGGVGLLYMTTYASFRLFDLLPAGIALVLLAFIAAMGVAMAVRENARWLAVISFAGGFLAPLLASTGSGNYVALFSWYLVLNIGIAVLAYYKSWRELSLMGLGATFAISGMWGWNYYRPEHFDSVEPFLIAFGVLYMLISVMFTLSGRDDAGKRLGRVDASLVFGTPVGFFTLQIPLVQGMEHGIGVSTAVAGFLYGLLALYVRHRGHRLLMQSLLVISVSLLTLTVPLELDSAETSAFWAMEGIGLLWLGIRQSSRMSAYTGLVLQFLSALFWLAGAPLAPDAGLGVTLGGLLIAVSGWVCAALLTKQEDDAPIVTKSISSFFQYWGLAWWLAVAANELGRHFDGEALLYAWLTGLTITALLLDTVCGRLGWQGLRQTVVTGFSLLWVGLLQSPLAMHGIPQQVNVLAGVAGLAYIGAAIWLWLSRNNHLGKSLAVAGLTLLVIAMPFSYDVSLAAAFIAMEGVGLLWLGIRQRNRMSAYAGLGLQFLSALFWLAGSPLDPDAGLGVTLAGILIAVSGWACAVLVTKQQDEQPLLETTLSSFFQYWGLLWWLGTVIAELDRHLDGRGLLLGSLAWTAVSALLLHLLNHRLHWIGLQRLSFGLWFAWILFILAEVTAGTSHPLSGWGLAVWPLSIAVAVFVTHTLRDEKLAMLYLGIPLFYQLFVSYELHWLVSDLLQPVAGSIWYKLPVAVTALFGVLAVLLARESWPVSRFPGVWMQYAAPGFLLILAGWSVLMLGNPVNVPSLTYMPILNPVGLILASSAWLAYRWLRQLKEEDLLFFDTKHLVALVGGIVFLQLNGELARMAHHWFDVPWSEYAMMRSIEFQALLSICWSLLALTLMFAGHRRSVRPAWMGGAVLLAVVVLKLFLVDLSGIGTIARIISFLGVGILMLVIGYVAPVPPAIDEMPGDGNSDEA